jgi:hypothetical protein
MAKVSISPESELQPYAPGGDYTHKEHGARVSSCEVRQLPGIDKETGAQRTGNFLNMSVMFRGPHQNFVFARTKPFGKNNTQMDTPSASAARRFVTQLGFDPDNFDTEDIVGKACDFTATLREYERDGEKQYANDIENIFGVTE